MCCDCIVIVAAIAVAVASGATITGSLELIRFNR